jgi:hypothetical protein
MLKRCQDYSFSRMAITQPPMQCVVQNNVTTGLVEHRPTGFMRSLSYEVSNKNGVSFVKGWCDEGGNTSWCAGQHEKIVQSIRIKLRTSFLLNEKGMQALHEHDGHWVMAKAYGSLGGNTDL